MPFEHAPVVHELPSLADQPAEVLGPVAAGSEATPESSEPEGEARMAAGASGSTSSMAEAAWKLASSLAAVSAADITLQSAWA